MRVVSLLLRRALMAFVGINAAQLWWWPDAPPWQLISVIVGSVFMVDRFYFAVLRRTEPLRRHRAHRRTAHRRAIAASGRPPRRRPLLGRVATWAGATLQLATSLMWGAGSLGVMSALWIGYFGEIDHARRSLFLLCYGFLAAALPCFMIGRFAARRGRRYLARIIHDPAGLKDSPYVLYLRAFDDDVSAHRMPFTATSGSWNPMFGMTSEGPLKPVDLTMEEEITGFFGSLGRIVAVGVPGEALAFGGADRMYLPRDDWKPVVSELIRDARLVVLAAATTEGTLWELAETCSLLPRTRLVVLLYGDEQRYEAFRDAVAGEFDNADLPDFPTPSPPSSLDGPPGPLLCGAVRFAPDGSAHYELFGPPDELSLLLGASSRRDNYRDAVASFVRDVEGDLALLDDPGSGPCPVDPTHTTRLIPSYRSGTTQRCCTVCGRDSPRGNA